MKEAKAKLEKLIEEIEEDGFLAEHSCVFILDNLKEILELM